MYEKIKNDIAQEYYVKNYPNDGQRFVAWYLRNIHNLDTFEAKACITDGAGDKQIDAVYIDDQSSTIYIIQGKFYKGDTVDAEPLREVTSSWIQIKNLPGIKDGTLFRKNVRQSLGTGNKVNKGIARTLRNNPEEFFFLHNGITAICSSIKIVNGTMSVKELNVVNGCQSLSTIFNCSESVRNVSDAYIMFRFYEISNAERADEISTCTNSQSAVKARDLRSNDKYVLAMKKAYEQHFTDGYFITKRGENADPVKYNTAHIVDLTSLGKQLIAWHSQRPTISYSESRIFDKGIYRFTIDKQGEILPTIRDADGFVKQVRLEDMALTPNLTQSLNNLSTHAVMAQILDEIEYVGDAIREIHVELQNDRLAMAEGARDKLIQARLIQDAKLREAAMLDVIHSATDAKRVLMRNFSQNMYHITEHSRKSDFQMMLDFKGEKDVSRKAIDAFQALVYITNSVQTECEGYAMLGEYEPCKECLEEFKSFILENRLNERDTLLLLNENSSQKRIEVVDQFTDIAARITAFDPKAHIEYSVHNLLTAETEHTGGDSDEQ